MSGKGEYDDEDDLFKDLYGEDGDTAEPREAGDKSDGVPPAKGEEAAAFEAEMNKPEPGAAEAAAAPPAAPAAPAGPAALAAPTAPAAASPVPTAPRAPAALSAPSAPAAMSLSSAPTAPSAPAAAVTPAAHSPFAAAMPAAVSSVRTRDDGYDFGAAALLTSSKMFIGGLNWDTTDESLRQYFSQFGEVTESLVMRDASTGRSRGFAFLTFKDPAAVQSVVTKEHILDGKIIDPKRAIPREEQEKTAKMFVGGIHPDVTEEEFTEFFQRYGPVLDATLMMDKDSGRPRGFGFITFENDSALEVCVQQQEIILHDKKVEVRRATPKGRPGQENNVGGRTGSNWGARGGASQQSSADTSNPYANMAPAMMAQYWRQMQAYYQAMQSMSQGGGGSSAGGASAGNGMNPMMMAMMQQQQGQGGGNQQFQQMQQMMQGQMQSGSDDSSSRDHSGRGGSGDRSWNSGGYRGNRGGYRGGRGGYHPYSR